MRLIKVIYNNDTLKIKDLVYSLHPERFIESFNIDYHAERRKAIPILTRHGTKNVPLIVFEDENLDEVSAIWSENNPDWEKEIKKHLKE